MKQVNVVAAVIVRNGRILATQRGYGEFKDGWEFPGGKIETGESPEEALKREIMEELKVEIHVHELVGVVEYDYTDFHLNMMCYWCTLKGGEVQLVEHEAGRWLEKGELWEVEWLPADWVVVERIKSSDKI